MSQSTAIVNVSVSEIQSMANAVAKSGLFGMKKPEEAMALMLIAQAEGLHPALAARDYHIIQGKPALKADAMMARFQAAGGKVEWHELTDELVSATFTHAQGGSAKISWGKKDAERAGFWGKDNWKKFPRQMLRARVISEGIRTVFPGVVIGTYTPEEVQDFDDKPQPKIMGNAEVVDDQPSPMESASVSGTDKELQYDLCNEICGICEGDELEAYIAENQENINSLPEIFRGTVTDLIFSRREEIKRGVAEGGVQPGGYKFLNVAKMDIFLEQAETALKRCDTLDEMEQWKKQNSRQIKALDERRMTILGTMFTTFKGLLLKNQPKNTMAAG